MIAVTDIPRHPEKLTTSWFQEIASQHYPGTTVQHVAVHAVDVGTTTRIRLAVDHDGPEHLPRKWFIKLPSLSWRARLITALPRLFRTEVRFYNEIAQAVPLSLPRVVIAQGKSGSKAILALEDVTASGATPGNPADALQPDQAAAVVRQLARLHAQFWNQPDRLYPWLGSSARALEDRLGRVLSVPLMRRGLHLATKYIPADFHEPCLRYAKQRHRIMQFLSSGTHTLVHHDCHPGNLFWKDALTPGFLDWQMVRSGESISDIAYFLATALEPEIRREHEENLLAIYAGELENQGIVEIRTANLLQRYRAHLIYPFEAMILTLAVGGMMHRESNITLLQRAAAAVVDSGTFQEVGLVR